MNMQNSYFWKDDTYIPSASLNKNESTEYLIIGGGISGLFTAYYLLEFGVKDIILIEKDTVGSGSTGYSAGMLVAEIETSSWYALAKTYGVEETRKYLLAQREAQDIVSALVVQENMDCEYNKEDLLYLAHTKKEWQDLLSESDIREQIGQEIINKEGEESQEEFRSMYFPYTEKVETSPTVNPLKFAHCFGNYLRKRGVRIYENTDCITIGDTQANTQSNSIIFSNIIYAIGTSEPSETIQSFLTTICVTRRLTDIELRKLRLDDKNMFLDVIKQSYHYGKITEDNRLLIGYGDDLYTGIKEVVSDEHVQNIKNFLCDQIGMDLPVEHMWSAAYALSKHILPFVSRKGNVARIGGAGTQMASAAVASYIAAKCTNNKHPLDTLFDKNLV